MFIDTNVVSYVKKGRLDVSIHGARISSVSASELLLIYGDKRTAANYYVPLLSRWHEFGIRTRRDHPFSKAATDQIVFSFGQDYESFVEFGSLAIAKLVNERNAQLLQKSIEFLDKSVQKCVREDFGVLIANEIECIPLNPQTIEIGYQLLDPFTSSGEKFKATFRNTWNDLLILAAAWARNEELYSKDNQLNRFAASSFGEFSELAGGFLKIRFPEVKASPLRRAADESKRYINRGWRASFRTGIKKAL
jgi:predicted nucleic acid-binding protein